ncbi:hypothetical protein D3C81_1248500 [compost metagenome]
MVHRDLLDRRRNGGGNGEPGGRTVDWGSARKVDMKVIVRWVQADPLQNGQNVLHRPFRHTLAA